MQVRSAFEDYFKSGYGPGEAIRMHESKLMLEKDGATILADASKNPRPRSVYHLHEIWRYSEFGKAWSAKGSIEKLKEKIESYAEEGTKIGFGHNIY